MLLPRLKKNNIAQSAKKEPYTRALFVGKYVRTDGLFCRILIDMRNRRFRLTQFVATALLVPITVYCMGVTGLFSLDTANAQSEAEISAREAVLKAELDQVLKEIAAQTVILRQKQAEGSSISRDIAILTAQINEAKLKIRAKNIAIETLGKDINNKTATIHDLQTRVAYGTSSLAQLLRKTEQVRDYTLTEMVLSNKHLSDFVRDADDYHVVKEQLNVVLDALKDNKQKTEVERTALDSKRANEIDQKISIEAEKRKIEKAEAEKARLLSLSKKEQQNYQSEISTREKRAAAIRDALFSLRDTSAIPFGSALQYATAASAATGVRPAFILAILTQESDMGKNVGRCNRPGDPPSKLWDAIMKPERDIEPYKRIVAGLGLSPESKPLSCPLGSGWGGAMGPSQFIPSTWESVAPQIAAAVGVVTPNPWDPKHAIFATAIYLSQLGAGEGGYTAERRAALRYYAGGNWNKPANAFYGDGVMQKATNIQENMIDQLKGV